MAYTAVPHGMNTCVPPCKPFHSTATSLMLTHRDSFYTTLCNALDYTCTVFPVTFVDPSMDIPDNNVGERVFYNTDDEAIHRLCALNLLVRILIVYWL